MDRLLPIAIALSLNNFAVSLALGALGYRDRAGRIAVAFGTFEFAVPLIGMALGRAASGFVADYAPWLSAAILGGIGIWTLADAVSDESRDQRLQKGLASWGTLVLLAGGLSLDNLAVGFGLGLSGFPIVTTAAVIAGSVLVFVLLGIKLGNEARRAWERRTRIAAGILMIGLAAAMASGII